MTLSKLVIHLPSEDATKAMRKAEQYHGIKLLTGDNTLKREGNLFAPVYWDCSQEELAEYNMRLRQAYRRERREYEELLREIVRGHEPNTPYSSTELEPTSRMSRVLAAVFG